jgi:hypothetical protein
MITSYCPECSCHQLPDAPPPPLDPPPPDELPLERELPELELERLLEPEPELETLCTNRINAAIVATGIATHQP